jgi:hypothetical protein
MARPVDPVPEGAQITRFQAQVKFGLFAAHDAVMASLLVLSWIVLAVWCFVGVPTLLQMLLLLVFDVLVLQVWLVVLVYRCLVFILDLNADINLMPEAAARIAAGFLQGKRPSTASAAEQR